MAASASPERAADGGSPAPPSDVVTHRFTTAWILALAAVALIAVTGWRLVDSTLALQRDAARLTRVVGTQIAVLDVIEDDTRALGRAETVGGARAALARVRAAMRQFDTVHARLTSPETIGAPGVAERSELLPTVAAVERTAPDVTTTVAALGETVVGLPIDTRGPHLGSLLSDDIHAVTAAVESYERALAALAGGYDQLAAARVEEARLIDRAMVVATLALLVVEALLVFRPATRRMREALESRRRQAESDRARAAAQLERLARHDHLTGLANRMSFRDRLEHGLAAAQRSGRRLAVMFLDLDKFKDINDSYGHEVGDALLVAVADRLRGVARRADTIARLGGDEFVLLLEGLESPDGAATVAAKVLEALAEPVEIGGRQLRVTTSIGIALHPDDADDAEDLLRNADSAMYEAKNAGRDTFRFSTPELRAVNVRRVRLISELRAAVAERRLRLVYQPQVSLTTGALVGVEAFVRWVRPDGTEVRAGDFISVLEDTDLMAPLGAWVLEEACRQNVAWQLDGLPRITMAINLSGRQFRQRDLPTTIASALEASGMPAELLELEITERSLDQDPDASAATLRLLKALGVRLAIDDFGTGYSSLAYLKRFPIDVLKIDGSFVHRLDRTGEEDDRAIPAAIIGLARHLGMGTTAEGVESAEQLELLRGIGCDRAQGYHIGRPLEPRELLRFSAGSATQPPLGAISAPSAGDLA